MCDESNIVKKQDDKTFKDIYLEKKIEYKINYDNQVNILLNDIRKLIYEFLNLYKMNYIEHILDTSQKVFKEVFYIYYRENDKNLIYWSYGNGRNHTIKTDVDKKIILKSDIFDNLSRQFLLDIYSEIFTGCNIKYIGDEFENNRKIYRVNIIFEE
jgi:hypothetical protein